MSLDGNGRPGISWCSYDGTDYEIYYSRWSGHSWSPEERVTANQTSDSQPSLAFISGNIPVFVWVQTVERLSRICLRYKLGPARRPGGIAPQTGVA